MLDELNENVKIKSKESEQFRCQNCNGEMIYDPKTKTLHCEICDSIREIEVTEFQVIENDFQSALKNLDINTLEITKDSYVNEVVCKSCGARSIFNGTVFADKCVYCGSAYVANVENSSYIKPEYIVPFKIDKQKADEKVYQWAKSRFYMNSKFKKNLKTEGLYGVYISYWTFDANTVTLYTARRGDHTSKPTTTVSNGKATVMVQQDTSWKNISGTHTEWFDDILVPAVNNKIPGIYEQSNIFKSSEIVPYDGRYITGFLAMKYEVELKQAWEIGQKLCSEKLKMKITSKIGGDVVENLNISPSFTDITYKHVLLPLWLCGYTYKGEIFTFIVNGQNGGVTGKYPLNYFKVALTGIVIVLWFVIIWVILMNV